jgi:hypothetical protein
MFFFPFSVFNFVGGLIRNDLMKTTHQSDKHGTVQWRYTLFVLTFYVFFIEQFKACAMNI